MMSGVASKLRKLSSKSSSKDHISVPSEDNGRGSKGTDKALVVPKGVEKTPSAPKGKSASVRRSHASAHGDIKDKGKLPEAMETEGDETKVEGTNDSEKESVPDYYLEPLEVLKSMFQRFSVGKVKPPAVVLHFPSIANLPYVGRNSKDCNFP